MHNKLIIIDQKREVMGEQSKIVYIQCNGSKTKGEGSDAFGKVLKYQVDISCQYLIVAFDTGRIHAYDVMTGDFLKSLEHPGMKFHANGGIFIDETCCYMGVLNYSRD